MKEIVEAFTKKNGGEAMPLIIQASVKVITAIGLVLLSYHRTGTVMPSSEAVRKATDLAEKLTE